MNNKLFKWLLLPLTLLVFTLSSCDLAQEEDDIDFLIEGTWEDPEWGGEIILAEDVFVSLWDNGGSKVKSHSAEVVAFDNDKFNKDTKVTDLGTHGYLVLKYLGGTGDGKYGILRWWTLKTEAGKTTMNYSEGFKASNPEAPFLEQVGIYYDSKDAAIDGMDDTFFTMKTNVTKQ